MRPAIALTTIFLIAGHGLRVDAAPAKQTDPNTIVALMLVGKDGARTDIIRNPQARTLEVHTRDFQGNVIRRDVFRLNGTGDPVACQIYDAKGNLVYRVQYAFDKLGRKIAEGTYNKAGKMVRRVVYAYDANGKALKPQEQAFADTSRQPLAPMAPEITPQGKLAQPPPKPGNKR
jgi:hypothetical protein